MSKQYGYNRRGQKQQQQQQAASESPIKFVQIDGLVCD